MVEKLSQDRIMKVVRAGEAFRDQLAFLQTSLKRALHAVHSGTMTKAEALDLIIPDILSDVPALHHVILATEATHYAATASRNAIERRRQTKRRREAGVQSREHYLYNRGGYAEAVLDNTISTILGSAESTLSESAKRAILDQIESEIPSITKHDLGSSTIEIPREGIATPEDFEGDIFGPVAKEELK